jgi:3-oxoacyl-[acyl-carrier-protein] synthase III
MSPNAVGIIGTGRALGSRLQTNAELCATTLRDVTPAWIEGKTGIKQRYLIDDGETTGSLALEASRHAMAAAGIGPKEIQMVVVSTFSGDYLFPAQSARLHRDLGLTGGQFYDLQANCSGFVSAITAVSDRMLRDPSVRYALVVGAEVQSPYIDYSDVETAIFFSDGAGAVVLGPVEDGRGVQASAFHADTSNVESVRVRGGGSRYPFAAAATVAESGLGWMEMRGIVTWKQAVTHLPGTIRRACEASSWTTDSVDLLVFHQANLQLITYIMAKMRIPAERTFTNVATVGNAGSASIPIALADAADRGLLARGDRVVLAGVGAGFTFGATCWIWEGDDT